MAITKVTAPNSVPTSVSDYEAQNNHLIGFINQVNNQSFILTDPTGTDAPDIKQGSYINHGGNLYLVDTEDYTPSGSPADGNVYIRVSGDATLTAEFITDISGYAYNQAYGNLVNSTYTLLPYLLVLASSAWTKYRLDVTTPQYRMNQDLRTTDNVTFASEIITGSEGARTAGDYAMYIYSGSATTISSSSYTKIFDCKIKYTGVYRVKFFMKASTSNTIYARVYKSGSAFGTEQTVTGSTTPTEKTEDLSFASGDILQIYGKTDGSGVTNIISNIRVCTSEEGIIIVA